MTKEDLQVSIGINLSQIRKEKGLTQEAVAEKIGISPTFYANLECGNKMMSVVTLRKIADTLHISADRILYGPTSDPHHIERLLDDVSPEVVSFIQKIIQLCTSEFPNNQREKIVGETSEGGNCTE